MDDVSFSCPLGNDASEITVALVTRPQPSHTQLITNMKLIRRVRPVQREPRKVHNSLEGNFRTVELCYEDNHA